MRRLFLLFCILGAWCVSSGSPLHFVQLTDPHYDPDYCRGCSIATECRGGTGPSGMFGFGGSLSHCQPPIALWDSALAAAVKEAPSPDAVFATGDFSRSGNTALNVTRDEYLKILSVVSTMLDEAYPTSIVVPVIGNHDYLPENLLEPGPNWVYSELGKMWDKWLPGDARQTFEQGGYYEREGKEGIRFLVLNNCMYATEDVLTANLTDPAGQFEWMIGVLDRARAAGERVWLVGHCYPGPSFWPHHNVRYLSISSSYADVIAAHVYGHLHMDVFAVVKDGGDRPVGSVFIGPGVTMNNGGLGAHNPAFRIYEADDSSFAAVNYVQYFLNLTRANEKEFAEWEVQYDARKLYGLADIGPSSLNELLERLWKDDVLFGVYWSLMFNDWLPVSDYDSCDGVCRRLLLCLMANLDELKLAECLVSP